MYVETMAFILATQSSLCSTHKKTRHYDRWILDCIELEAKLFITSITTCYKDGWFVVSTYSTIMMEGFIVGIVS